MKLTKLIGVFALFLITASAVNAASFTGDGTYQMSVGDEVTSDNGNVVKVTSVWETTDTGEIYVDLQMNGYRSIQFTNGETSGLSIATSGGSDVIEVTVSDANPDASTVELTITSVDDEDPDISTPDEETDDTGEDDTEDVVVHRGDGEYTLSLGDKVISDSGYTVILVGNVGNKLAKIRLLDSTGDSVSLDDGYLSAGGAERADIKEHGLTVKAETVNEETGAVEMVVSSSLSVELLPGWNLFSAPLGPGPTGYEILENTCGDVDTLDVWHWDTSQGRYTKSFPYAKQGQWLKVDERCHIEFGGRPVYVDGIELDAGWNQIGGPTSPVEASEMMGDCDVVSGPWGYSAAQTRWIKASTLEQGTGYFLNVADDCTLGQTSSGIPSLPGE